MCGVRKRKRNCVCKIVCVCVCAGITIPPGVWCGAYFAMRYELLCPDGAASGGACKVVCFALITVREENVQRAKNECSARRRSSRRGVVRCGVHAAECVRVVCVQRRAVSVVAVPGYSRFHETVCAHGAA